MRPTMTPAAAVRSAPLTPRRANRSGRPTWSSAHRPSCLDADAAGADQAQRVDVDPLDVGRCAGRRARLRAAGEQLRGDALRFVLDGARAIGHQRCLAAEHVGDPGAQQRPLWLSNVEVAPEVEQRALAHGVAEAFGVDQAV